MMRSGRCPRQTIRDHYTSGSTIRDPVWFQISARRFPVPQRRARHAGQMMDFPQALVRSSREWHSRTDCRDSADEVFGRLPIKGPGLRIDLDVRRVWTCPQCGQTVRRGGRVTAVRCSRCSNDEDVWLHLDSESVPFRSVPPSGDPEDIGLGPPNSSAGNIENRFPAVHIPEEPARQKQSRRQKKAAAKAAKARSAKEAADTQPPESQAAESSESDGRTAEPAATAAASADTEAAESAQADTSAQPAAVPKAAETGKSRAAGPRPQSTPSSDAETAPASSADDSKSVSGTDAAEPREAEGGSSGTPRPRKRRQRRRGRRRNRQASQSESGGSSEHGTSASKPAAGGPRESKRRSSGESSPGSPPGSDAAR